MEERKAKKAVLTHRVHTRVTKEKYDELTALLKQSRGLHSHSELLRHILDHQAIITRTYDETMDKVIEELSAIRKELQAIGVNINQVTRRFHAEDLPEGKLFQALEIAKLYQQADAKVTLLFSIISNLSKQWLPE